MLDAAAFCRGLVEEGTIYAFLADCRHELFKDEDFQDLFPSSKGRPSIPVAKRWHDLGFNAYAARRILTAGGTFDEVLRLRAEGLSVAEVGKRVAGK
jgi:hypothetical protein